MHSFYSKEIQSDKYLLSPEESAHCAGVLRHQAGDLIRVMDGNGTTYECKITSAHKKACEFEVLNKNYCKKIQPHVHLIIAPTKNLDRMEWMIEKVQEIGIDRVSFIRTANSERKVLKTERLYRKAISAMKQSKNPYLIDIGELDTFQAIIPAISEDIKLIAHLTEGCIPLKEACQGFNSVAILIGPEGDFSQKEIAQAESHQFQSVSLGSHTYRTETAGLVASCLLKL